MSESIINSLSEREKEIIYFLICNPLSWIKLRKCPFMFFLVDENDKLTSLRTKDVYALIHSGRLKNHFIPDAHERYEATDQARKEFAKASEVHSTLKLGRLNLSLNKKETLSKK